ncbi:hypothetical protein [Vibrio genomosp. F10]|uniref:hypothetical protein n=1 Tax=Vibrio genomosp. F10 TaxID=723171 RepID=UPI00147C4BF7|nr:hypothetical protein [Vibrio genomosp. F10]
MSKNTYRSMFNNIERIKQQREEYMKEIASFEAMLEANRTESEELSKKVER